MIIRKLGEIAFIVRLQQKRQPPQSVAKYIDQTTKLYTTYLLFLNFAKTHFYNNRWPGG